MKERVLETIKDYKNSSNKDITDALDLLNQDFEFTKKMLIEMSHHLDKVENTYNLLLKELKNRQNG
jgi:hypothetical protein